MMMMMGVMKIMMMMGLSRPLSLGHLCCSDAFEINNAVDL